MNNFLICSIFIFLSIFRSYSQDQESVDYINYFEKGLKYYDDKNFTKAIKYFKICNDRINTIKSTPFPNLDHAIILYYLGESYYNNNNFQEAKLYLVESLQLFSKIDTRESLEYQCSIKLTLRSLLSDSDKDNLIQISSEILEIMRIIYGNTSEELANAFYPVGLIYYRFNEYENARIMFENSFNILDKSNKKNH